MRRPPKNGTRVQNINTLVVDGNALFQRGFHGAKDEYNKDGDHIGGIYQFITVVRRLLEEELYQKVYVFWDGEFSGKLRYELYPDYKSGRGKDYINGTKPEDKNQLVETYVVQAFLDDLFVRQVRNRGGDVEGDDFIAYYCKTKEPNDKVTIVTNDRDLCQLINEDVRIFLIDKKAYVTHYNFNQHANPNPKKVSIFDFHIKNIVLIKTICGDASDSIRGVKGMGEKTLLKYFPDLTKRPVSLQEIMEQAQLIQDERSEAKKKPIKALTNLLEGVTTDKTGKEVLTLGEDLYKRNQVLVDLSLPMMTEESVRQFNEVKDNTLDPSERGVKEAYKKMKKFGIDNKVGAAGIGYLLPFKKLMEREKRIITS
jgi:5'-3' exonuclease